MNHKKQNFLIYKYLKQYNIMLFYNLWSWQNKKENILHLKVLQQVKDYYNMIFIVMEIVCFRKDMIGIDLSPIYNNMD